MTDALPKKRPADDRRYIVMTRSYHVTGRITVGQLYVPTLPIGAAIDMIADDRKCSQAFPAYPHCDYWLVPV